ncbi:MAG: hypothetical protein IPK02_05510 [Candidatus Accumulibacter sp.]|uniref:Uncharacterized protein n=1 Tax=Candidatus Accumulibacter affinis TaxID=2954384 RepID=A0A935W2W6_9PROT|nr:hypothetical protein [Candidatus Accumulibacter affinis]
MEQSDSISRFSFDALGHASLSGTITGIGLDIPIGLRFSPWGELFVANEETSAVSRWTFDVSHNAIANGSLRRRQAVSTGWSSLLRPR